MASPFEMMKGKQTQTFWDAFYRAIGEVIIEDSPNQYANASQKHKHTANDLRMMVGYRAAVITEALKRIPDEVITKDSDNAQPHP